MQNMSKIMPKMEQQGHRNVKNIGGDMPTLEFRIQDIRGRSQILLARFCSFLTNQLTLLARLLNRVSLLS